jgi:Mce-associated membrane protein
VTRHRADTVTPTNGADAEEESATVAGDLDTTIEDGRSSEATEGSDAADVSDSDLAPSADDLLDEPGVEADTAAPIAALKRIWHNPVLTSGVLPGLALVLAVGVGGLQWHNTSVRADDRARTESVQSAKDAAVAMLSYKPDSADTDLGGARALLTGDFKDQYTTLTKNVVIPDSKQKHISAVVSVPAAASVSADSDHAVALVLVNQTVTVGAGTPTATASSVKVTLKKVDGHWLVSAFDPI